ncbi:MAG: hypothetical protein P8H35_03360 [Flavobacteriales bacterium]|nr:hypothetical protein [Flavobacteriales bacterium]
MCSLEKKLLFGSNVWIGYDATVLKGVKIGGVPAKEIKKIN